MCPFINTNSAEYHRCIVNSCDKKSLNEFLLPLKKKSYIDITCLTVNMSNTELKEFCFQFIRMLIKLYKSYLVIFTVFSAYFHEKKNTQI